MPFVDLTQRSPEWLGARRGKITASLAAACLGLDPYKGPLAAFNEITGPAKQNNGNKHTAWGVEFEAEARDAYEVESGNLVNPGGFWVHDAHPWLAASPDGLVGAEGLVEIKCPSKIPEAVPVYHGVQMTVQMACSNRSWCDYWVWSQNGHFLKRVERSSDYEAEILAGLLAFYEAYILPDQAPPRRRAKGH